MILSFKKHFFFYIILLIILVSCQFQETIKNHGIVYLENRSTALSVNKSNKNDVIKLLGRPQIQSFNDDDMWIYIERTLTKGKFHKLGKNILKENNILALEFNKYGVLIAKEYFEKEEMNKIAFLKKNTDNDISQKSFVSNFLQSIRQKMYQSRK